MTTLFFKVASAFVFVVAFGTCKLIGIPLNIRKFWVLATFQTFQEAMRSILNTISMIIQIKVSLDRIVSFLYLKDL